MTVTDRDAEASNNREIDGGNTPIDAMREVFERFEINGSGDDCQVWQLYPAIESGDVVFTGTRAECETYRLERAYEAARAAEWRGISTAPKDGTLILVYWPKTYGGPEHISIRQGHVITSSQSEITHWMPVPLPPAPASEARECLECGEDGCKDILCNSPAPGTTKG